MKQRADTRKAFELYLDEIGLSLSPEQWIIGGKDRSPVESKSVRKRFANRWMS